MGRECTASDECGFDYDCKEGTCQRKNGHGGSCESDDDCLHSLSCNQYVKKCDKRKPGGMLGFCSSDDHCKDPSWSKCSRGACRRVIGGYCKSSDYNYYCAS